MSKLKLVDYVRINPDPSLSTLSKREKINLIDFHMGSSSPSKGLLVSWDLSHSGRRINNRIYSVKGQQAGVDSILNPYPKPILRHHDQETDPIGRFVAAEWQDLNQEAMSFFVDVNAYSDVLDAFDEDNPEKIYKSLKSSGLLTNKNWPGLGRMRVSARITDKDAIEKFLDGRYITFSAGSTTDRHTCSICMEDWAKGDFCEHRHGKIYDGEVCVFITGNFDVLEGSVVNSPADDLSQVLSMEVSDDMPQDLKRDKSCTLDSRSLYITDSIYKMENTMPEVTVDATKVVAVNTEGSTEETVEGVKEQDTATAEDAAVVADSNEEIGLEEATEVGVENENTVSLENEDGVTVQEETQEKAEEENINTNEDGKEEEVQKSEDGTGELGVHESVVEEVQADNDDADVDWYLLDAALQIEVGADSLTAEQRENLLDEVFCGPQRSFPIADAAHVAAARRLIERAKLSESQKEKVKNCVDKRAASLGCDKDLSVEDHMKKDFVQALHRIEELESNLTDLLKLINTAQEEVKDTESVDSVTEDSNPSVSERVESPSVNSSDNLVNPKNSLGEFESKVLDNYNLILQKDGQVVAEQYLASKQRYLPRGFHPNKYNN